MTKWLQWIVLTSITGSPLLSILILIAAWWVLDHYTLGILPSPFGFVERFRRALRLRRELEHNPHDRRARFELADLYVGQRRHGAAVEVLKPAIEAGDHDAATLFLMGVACYGAGHAKQAEVFLAAAADAEPGFRQGAVDLELGRGRLAFGDHAGAREALERFVQARHATVEGKVLLARALAAGGDATTASKLKDDAWRDYAAAPRFQKRRERFWAWRAKPARPLSYLAVAVVIGALFARFGAPIVEELAAEPSAYADPYDDYDP